MKMCLWAGKKQFKLLLMIGMLVVMCAGFSSNKEPWQKVNAGLNANRVNCITLDSQNNIYIGTEKGLFAYQRDKQRFVPFFSHPILLNSIRHIAVDPGQPGQMLVSTDAGLVFTPDHGRSWKLIYQPRDREAGACYEALFSRGRIFAATSDGLLMREKDRWIQFSGRLGTEHIYHIAQDHAAVYAATASRVYRVDQKDLSVTMILNASGHETFSGPEDDDLYAPARASVRALDVIEESGRPMLFIATDQDIRYSRNQGADWEKVSVPNFQTEEISSFLAIPAEKHSAPLIRREGSALNSGTIGSHGESVPAQAPAGDPGPDALLFAGTGLGVFQFHGGRWLTLYQGMETNAILALAADQEGGLYAGTDRGLFYRKITAPNVQNTAPKQDPVLAREQARARFRTLRAAFAHEPSVHEVQRMAVEYAEVQPEKIKQWRRRADRKGWMPSLSLGLDVDKNKTVSDSVYGSYSSGGQHYIGPDDKTFYNNLGFDVSLSWDLSDLVWNSDQLSIDSRSKLMVELREDILDQVTRLYFERRRVQFELIDREQAVDQAELVDKQMRIEELTAVIDALTGGGFSQLLAEERQQETLNDNPIVSSQTFSAQRAQVR